MLCRAACRSVSLPIRKAHLKWAELVHRQKQRLGFAMKTRWFLLISSCFLTLSACGGTQQNVPKAEPDLIATLKARPSLTRFTAALEETGVAATLRPDGAYTIFAPMDAAVAKGGRLDAATVKHHILSERVTFGDMAGENISYTTLHTDEIEIDAIETIQIGDGLMVESDIVATNGVIHVIDTVLTPGEVPTTLLPPTNLGPAPTADPADTAAPPATQ